jgi:hypothetical protein
VLSPLVAGENCASILSVVDFERDETFI